ncbi:conserved hypothetical protein [Xanthomonas euvesicatoria pv. vesicatoria str. 85-10]|uniref:GTPase n=5 Tax=Xanthomonas TaxID=338 RepID=Q3BN27_XANE5|nr:conserved hypothetical protein [Xanthomonas euvesicatoria pv. vesicatoria str. 85-10]
MAAARGRCGGTGPGQRRWLGRLAGIAGSTGAGAGGIAHARGWRLDQARRHRARTQRTHAPAVVLAARHPGRGAGIAAAALPWRIRCRRSDAAACAVAGACGPGQWLRAVARWRGAGAGHRRAGPLGLARRARPCRDRVAPTHFLRSAVFRPARASAPGAAGSGTRPCAAIAPVAGIDCRDQLASPVAGHRPPACTALAPAGAGQCLQAAAANGGMPVRRCTCQRPCPDCGDSRACNAAPPRWRQHAVLFLGRTSVRPFPLPGAVMSLPANKLVFVGGMGAGKTTAVRSISDVEPVSTEMPLSQDAYGDKTYTTVALDYSSIELEDGELLHVYGVPGQKYLDFMWPLVCDGALGVIVLTNARDPQMLTATLELLREFSQIAPEASLAVGITMTDEVEDFLVPPFRETLVAEGFRVPVMRVDARSATQITFLVKSLLSYRYTSATS